MIKVATKIIILVISVSFFAIASLLAVIVNYMQLGPSIYIIVLLIAVFVFFSGIAIGQNFASPMRKILEKAQELSKGNLSGKIYVETKDELSELALILNKIAEELQASHERETNEEKSIGIKVQARTKELQETINALEQKVKNRTIELEKLIKESNKK